MYLIFVPSSPLLTPTSPPDVQANKFVFSRKKQNSAALKTSRTKSMKASASCSFLFLIQSCL